MIYSKRMVRTDVPLRYKRRHHNTKRLGNLNETKKKKKNMQRSADYNATYARVLHTRIETITFITQTTSTHRSAVDIIIYIC